MQHNVMNKWGPLDHKGQPDRASQKTKPGPVGLLKISLMQNLKWLVGPCDTEVLKQKVVSTLSLTMDKAG